MKGEYIMNIKITSRHFKPHATLTEYAEKAIEDLSHFYDGIIKAEVIFSYEKSHDSVKNAEISLTVYGTILTGIGSSEEYEKSIDIAIAKIKTRLKKYKEKLHEKDRKGVRKICEKE
jgi:ribosomal subunit interface protein